MTASPVSLDVNKVCFDEDKISLIHMKKLEKDKALLNGVDVENME